MRIAVGFLCSLIVQPALAQSAASDASVLSLESSAAATSLTLQEGSKLVVTALRPVGAVVEVDAIVEVRA